MEHACGIWEDEHGEEARREYEAAQRDPAVRRETERRAKNKRRTDDADDDVDEDGDAVVVKLGRKKRAVRSLRTSG